MRSSLSAIVVRPSSFSEIADLREEFRQSLNCQFVRYSILPRGLATPYAVTLGDKLIGYGGVWIKHFPDRIMEFYIQPTYAELAREALTKLIATSRASSLEAQANIDQMFSLAQFACDSLEKENVLFDAERATSTILKGYSFRPRRDGDTGPEGEWVVTRNGQVVGAGGILTHYNPPYGDIYMAVVESERRKGIGSFLVQELCRVCVERGLKPSARCDADNIVSRKTLLRGGMRVCGYLVAGELKRPNN